MPAVVVSNCLSKQTMTADAWKNYVQKFDGRDLQIKNILCMLNFNDSVVIAGQKNHRTQIKKTGMGEAHVAQQDE